MYPPRLLYRPSYLLTVFITVFYPIFFNLRKDSYYQNLNRLFKNSIAFPTNDLNGHKAPCLKKFMYVCNTF